MKGADEHPVAEGTERDAFVEHYELEPIDRQTNGPQLFYGMRYHIHITKPGETETFHDQVGYWLWEPAANTVTFTLGIPRGQVLLAAGPAEPDATEFELHATVGSEVHGILSNPFLDQAFRTLSYRISVSVHDDGRGPTKKRACSRSPAVTSRSSHRPQHLDARRPPEPNPWRGQDPPTRAPGGLGIGSLLAEAPLTASAHPRRRPLLQEGGHALSGSTPRTCRQRAPLSRRTPLPRPRRARRRSAASLPRWRRGREEEVGHDRIDLGVEILVGDGHGDQAQPGCSSAPKRLPRRNAAWASPRRILGRQTTEIIAGARPRGPR